MKIYIDTFFDDLHIVEKAIFISGLKYIKTKDKQTHYALFIVTCDMRKNINKKKIINILKLLISLKYTRLWIERIFLAKMQSFEKNLIL